MGVEKENEKSNKHAKIFEESEKIEKLLNFINLTKEINLLRCIDWAKFEKNFKRLKRMSRGI